MGFVFKNNYTFCLFYGFKIYFHKNNCKLFKRQINFHVNPANDVVVLRIPVEYKRLWFSVLVRAWQDNLVRKVEKVEKNWENKVVQLCQLYNFICTTLFSQFPDSEPEFVCIQFVWFIVVLQSVQSTGSMLKFFPCSKGLIQIGIRHLTDWGWSCGTKAFTILLSMRTPWNNIPFGLPWPKRKDPN